MFDRDTLIIAYDPMRGEPRGPRKRTLKDVFERGRGLLDVATAYDYVFRATRHPSAADNRLQAAGTIVLGDVNAEAKPLPTFAPEELGRSEEHTSELQSLMRRSYAVFGLKKKKET